MEIKKFTLKVYPFRTAISKQVKYRTKLSIFGLMLIMPVTAAFINIPEKWIITQWRKLLQR